MTRNEFHIIDNYRIIAFLGLLMSISLCAIGCKTLMSIHKANTGFANKVFKKNLFRLAFFLVTSMAVHHFIKDTTNVVEKHMDKFGEQRMGPQRYRHHKKPAVFQNIDEDEPFLMAEEPEEEFSVPEDMEDMPTIADESGFASDDEEESSNDSGRHLKSSNYTRDDLEKMLNKTIQKIQNLKAELSSANRTISEDMRELDNFDEKYNWAKEQLEINNETITELKQQLAKVTEKIISLKKDMIKANATHNYTEYQQDLKWIMYLSEEYQQIQAEINNGTNFTNSELEKMLKYDLSQIDELKAELNKTWATIKNDGKWLNIYESKYEWIVEQLKNSSNNNDTIAKLEKELKDITYKIIALKKDIVYANKTHNFTRIK